jgi:chemotaxis protein MotB
MQRRRIAHEDSWLFSYADLITNLLLFFVVLLTAANISTSKMQQIAEAVSGEQAPESLAQIKEEIDKKIEEKNLEEVVRTALTDAGLVLSLNSGVVFGSGAARIHPEMEATVASMLEELAPYSERYRFAVEGHTDSQPVLKNSPFPSNWELSTARAIAVRARLEAIGVDRARIRVEGYADTVPLPEDTLKDIELEERRARHRRVIVRVF